MKGKQMNDWQEGDAGTAKLWADYDAKNDPGPGASQQPVAFKAAFYGRVSTDDNQDPETSRNWQLKIATDLIVPAGGTVVKEYFDIGYSRALEWVQRPQSRDLLKELGNPNRGWNAIVVGESQRSFFGNQFESIVQQCRYAGVDVWIPELQGRFDPENPLHLWSMSITGNLSRTETQVVTKRVRAAMESQTTIQGRFQGGRPPFGYLIEPYAEHPNPRKAIDGKKLSRLAPDPLTSHIVPLIFDSYLRGMSLREVARSLTRMGIAPPSVRDPRRNSHRTNTGWSAASVDVILKNARYTGHEVWGKTRKVRQPIDPTNLQLGTRTVFRPALNPPARSNLPAHEALVTVADFMEVQARIARAANSGLGGERRAREGTASHPVAGLVRCGHCGFKMERTYRKLTDGTKKFTYRCRTARNVPSSPLLEGHPDRVNIWGDDVAEYARSWVVQLLRELGDDVIPTMEMMSAITADAESPRGGISRELAELALAQESLTDAIAGGGNAAPLVARIEKNELRIKALNAELLAAAPLSQGLSATDLATQIDALGGIDGLVSPDASPALLSDLYARVDFEILVRVVGHERHALIVAGRPPKIIT